MAKKVQSTPAEGEVATDEYIATEAISEPESAITLTPTETALAELNQFDVKLIEARKLKALEIAGINDKVGYKKVEEARLKVKRDKISVEAIRKEIVEPVNRFLGQVNAKAKGYFNEFKEIEDDLDRKSTAHENEIATEKRRKEEEAEAKYQNRLNQVITIGASFNGHTSWKVGEISLTSSEIRTLPDEDFIRFTHLMEQEAESIRAAQKAEEDRIAAEKAEQEAEAERLKVEAEKQESERKKLEQDKLDFAAEQERVKAESAKAERDRLAKIAKDEADLKEAQIKLRETRRRTQLEKIAPGLEEDTDNRILAYRGHILINTDDLSSISDEKWVDLIEYLPEALKDVDTEIKTAEEEAEKKRLADIATAEAVAVQMEKNRKSDEEKEAKRKAALLPDKEKLEALVVTLSQITDGIALYSKESKAILVAVEDKISETATFITEQLKQL